MTMDYETLAAVLSAAGVTTGDLDAVAGLLSGADALTLGGFCDEALDILAGTQIDGTFNTWKGHIARLCDPDSGFGASTFAQVDEVDIRRLATTVMAESVASGRARHGKGAREHFVNAARWYFTQAIAKKHTTTNPAKAIRHLARDEPSRLALTGLQLEGIWMVALLKMGDPELFGLLCDFHRETAARREGALGLTVGNLLAHHNLVWLHEKAVKTRKQPVSGRLMDRLVAHGKSRGATETGDALFRRANGVPITRRDYEKFYTTVDTYLPWAKEVDFGVHHLRHTTGTDVERIAGAAVAARYLGHSATSQGTTGTYTKATPEEVRRAHAILFEPDRLDPRTITTIDASPQGAPSQDDHDGASTCDVHL